MSDEDVRWVSWCAVDQGVEITFNNGLVVVLSEADLELMLKSYQGRKAVHEGLR